MITKEEVLQKVNDYCNEKSYTNETLTDAFKDKFSEIFAKNYSQSESIEDEALLNSLHFNLNTAFSSASKLITERQKTFSEKESGYLKQIEELNKKIEDASKPLPKTEIPKEIQEKLDRLENLETDRRKSEKFNEVLAEAKKNIRSNLHHSLENYAKDFEISLDEDVKDQASKLTERFSEIFKDTIGDVRPYAPKQDRKKLDEFLESIPKIGFND